MIYLDNAGSPHINEKLLNIIKKNINEMNNISNPHSNNITGLNMSNIIEEVRNKILNMYNTNKEEYSCIFTHNATHSIKLIGEYFDWDIDSKYIYMKSNKNHNHNYIGGGDAELYCILCGGPTFSRPVITDTTLFEKYKHW